MNKAKKTEAIIRCKEYYMRPFACCFAIFIIFLWHTLSYSEALENTDSLDMVYLDESHCLTSPEIRGENDKPISCCCRDALVDAQYLYTNYFVGKDKKLTGAFLTLMDRALEACGERYDVLNVARTKKWQWNGPQVTREYPPESEINRIKPDSNGFRDVKFKVHLAYRNPKGQVIKVEDYMVSYKVSAQTKK